MEKREKIKKIRAFWGNRAGYSLIETLVVVLIVGILTAVALPQYQRAVEKARYATARRTAATLARGMDAYYETYKKYTAVMDNLDVSVNYKRTNTGCTEESEACTYYLSDGGYCSLHKDGRVYCYTKGDSFFYAVFLSNSWRSGKTFCFAQKTNISADDWNYKFCQRETGSSSPSSSWAHATGYKAFEYIR